MEEIKKAKDKVRNEKQVQEE